MAVPVIYVNIYDLIEASTVVLVTVKRVGYFIRRAKFWRNPHTPRDYFRKCTKYGGESIKFVEITIHETSELQQIKGGKVIR